MDKSIYLEIEKSESGLHKKFHALRDKELEWYERQALSHFDLIRFPNINENQLIQQILRKSPNDKKRKRSLETYYVANAVAYLRVIKDLLSENFVRNFGGLHTLDDLVIYNYNRLFRNLLFDSLILLNEYCATIKKEPAPYGCGKSHHQHTSTLYHSLRCSIFGQSSFHSYREVQPDLSISIIRQIVELRVRRAFGILGWYDVAKDSIMPLPMSRLFEVIDKYKYDIDFSMPFDCLKRIYNWSNIFLHAGFKEYCWTHILVADYLNEFCTGKRNGNNLSNGVSMKRHVLKSIISELENNLAKNNGRLILQSPEAEIQEKDN